MFARNANQREAVGRSLQRRISRSTFRLAAGLHRKSVAAQSEGVTNADNSEVALGQPVNRERAPMRSNVNVRSIQSSAFGFGNSASGVFCGGDWLCSVLKVHESGIRLVRFVSKYVRFHSSVRLR